MSTERKYRKWTVEDRATLRRMFPGVTTADIARRLRRSYSSIVNQAGLMALKKSADFFRSERSGRLNLNLGTAHRFPKGNTPWNAGKKGWTPGGRSVATRFRKGNYSARWDRSIYCVGALRVNADGGLEIKIREGQRAWVSLARYVWETERGPIPKGGIIRPCNRDAHDTRIENLWLGTRADLMQENTYHQYPKEIARLIQLRGALNRQINRRM